MWKNGTYFCQDCKFITNIDVLARHHEGSQKIADDKWFCPHYKMRSNLDGWIKDMFDYQYNPENPEAPLNKSHWIINWTKKIK